MRVLFATTGHSGHLLPLVHVARACEAAGHEVAIACEHSRAPVVERLGFDARPFAEPPDEAWRPFVPRLATIPQPEADVLMIREWFGRLQTRAALPHVLATVQSWRPDVVVHECYHYAGPLAAERHGIPFARVALGLASTEAWALGLAAPAVDELRGELGLPPDPAGERLRRAPALTTVPDALDDGPGRRFRAAAAPDGSGEIPPPDAWSSPADPLVYLTFGSVTGSLPLFPGLYRDALAALAPLPARVLLTLGDDADPAELGPLPANVLMQRWLAQDAVLPHAAAAIGHGGFGTTVGALAHGVPSVVVPLFAGDQWRNARRVAELGAGILVGQGPRGAMEPPDLATLHDAVARVLVEPAFREAARRVAASAAALPEVDAAVRALEAIAAREPVTV